MKHHSWRLLGRELDPALKRQIIRDKPKAGDRLIAIRMDLDSPTGFGKCRVRVLHASRRRIVWLTNEGLRSATPKDYFRMLCTTLERGAVWFPTR